MSTEEEQKKLVRMNIIYKALEDGWSVKKSDNNSKTFEFTKNKSLEDDYKGLIIFSKSNVCDDILQHLENIKKIEKSSEKTSEKNHQESKRSVSTPIIVRK